VRSSLQMLRRPSSALAGCALAVAIATFALTGAAQPEAQPTPPPLPPSGDAGTPPPLPPSGLTSTPPWTGQPPIPSPTVPLAPATRTTKPNVVLPDYPNFGTADPGVPKARANPTMMYFGIAMTTGGLLLTIAGSIITASSIDAVDIYCDGPAVCLHRDDTVKKGIGTTMLVGGAAIGAIGFPLWLFGGRMVPVKPKVGSVTPDVRVGAGSARVSFAF
jgi:hypothetical protein